MEGIFTGTVLGPAGALGALALTSSAVLLSPSAPTTFTSHLFSVTDLPVALKAYNLVSPQVVTVYICEMFNNTLYSSPFTLNGHGVALDENNTVLVLDIPGIYRVGETSGTISTLLVTQTKTAMSYHSYGLRAFSQAP